MSIHIVGAGLAGLAAAVALTKAGHKVTVFEAAKAAGGRARSYFDTQLGHRIDNGNHLLLSGNHAAMDYLATIGASDSLTGPKDPVFPFINLATGQHWALRLNRGPIPWWIFAPNRRVPCTRALDYLALLKLRGATPSDLVEPLLGGPHALYREFLEPMTISALNTMPSIAAAGPLKTVFAETVERGGEFSIPRYAKAGLTESFIDPALTWLLSRGADIQFGTRITALNPAQQTILAVPANAAITLAPGITAPAEFESICNLHFIHHLPPGEAGFWGFTGGMAEWAFAKGDILSVTISAANRYAELDNRHIAATVWAELASAFNLPAEIPAHRVIWERRATFMATPAELARRPGPRTANPNWVLAGDWTATGLPATIEGAIRSGNTAAQVILGA